MRSMFSSPVIRPSTAENCPVTPMAPRTACGAVARSWPATRTSPPSAQTRVERIWTVVVLPAPFGPSSANTDPAGMRRSMPEDGLVAVRLAQTHSGDGGGRLRTGS
ncbi:hypothetical protein STENM327S_06427 [Streptomyces tendae]